MHVAVLTGGGVPNPTSGGGALTAYTVLRQALTEGHDVTAFALYDVDYRDPIGAGAEARAAHLREIGANVVTIPAVGARLAERRRLGPGGRVRAALRMPSVTDVYPHVLDRRRMRDAIAAAGCEVAFAYHWEPLAASEALPIPRVAGVGDPSHLPLRYRWLDANPEATRLPVRLRASARAQRRAMARMLDQCAEYGAFAAHHAEWLRENGAPHCRYLHTPVPDEAGQSWEADRRAAATGGQARILLLGHLAGIATIDGLRVFGRMLPELDRIFGAGGYVVDVVGGYEPKKDLLALLDHPAVHRHGHTDDPASWLRQADVLLVPSSIPLGIRVRIITGLSFGTPVVSHQANALGIPELVHEENALLGSTPAELAVAIARVTDDSSLRSTLEQNGRKTYERWFQPDVAAREIVDLLERTRT